MVMKLLVNLMAIRSSKSLDVLEDFISIMSKSIVKNSFFYMIYNLLNMLFPFVISIYVSHILTPVSIGEVDYARNIVSYFSILAFLGIPTYGLREISRIRNDTDELNKVYSELFTINLITTIVFSSLYFIYVFVFCRESIVLYLVVGIIVVANAINISWLYEGLEEFQFISIRNAVFKLIMFVFMVVFVKEENNIIPYALITVIGIVGNNMFNIIYSKRFVHLSFQHLNLKRHLKSILFLAAVNLAIEIYTLVDTTMIGKMTTKDHVAFYTYAGKTNVMLRQVTNTITYVLVPRITQYYNEQRMNDFNKLISKGFKAILIISIPIIIGIQYTSEFLFQFVFGGDYIASGIVEKVLCLTIVISPIGYLLGSRIMLVTNNEKKMVIVVGIGAIVNVIGNLLLIPRYYEFGAAVASVISELVIMIIYVMLGKKYIRLFAWARSVMCCIAASIAEFVFLLIVSLEFDDSLIIICLKVIGSILLYLSILFILKEDIITNYSHSIINRFFKR